MNVDFLLPSRHDVTFSKPLFSDTDCLRCHFSEEGNPSRKLRLNNIGDFAAFRSRYFITSTFGCRGYLFPHAAAISGLPLSSFQFQGQYFCERTQFSMCFVCSAKCQIRRSDDNTGSYRLGIAGAVVVVSTTSRLHQGQLFT